MSDLEYLMENTPARMNKKEMSPYDIKKAIIADVNTMEDIGSSALEIVPQFNIASDMLRPGLPYMIRNIKDGTTIIATLSVVDLKKLKFDSWKGRIEIDAKEYHKGDDWKIYPANTKEGGMLL